MEWPIELDTEILLRLSAEHPSLPLLEAEGLLGTIDPGLRTESLGQGLLLARLGIGPEQSEAAVRRLALTREASRVLQIVDGLEAPIEARLLEEVVDRSFLVRARGFGPAARKIEEDLGRRILAEARRRCASTRVSVEAPSVVLKVERVEGKVFLSRLLAKPGRSTYVARARSRPFRQPVSLDPVLARAMVNMSGVLEGETLLDPLCGTGTILHEAGLLGARIFGIDASGSMVAGAKLNLASLRPVLICGDALRASSLLRMAFDHIVTDPPYGRASPSRMAGTSARDLLVRLPSACSGLLRPGGTLCLASPSTVDLCEELAAANLRLRAFAYQRIHGSLGRHLYLAQAG